MIAAAGVAVIATLYLGVSAIVLSSSLRATRTLANQTPTDSGFVAEQVLFESDVDRIPLVGWLLPPSRDRAPSSEDRAIVLLHGLNCHSWSGMQPDLAEAYVEAAFTVLVFDFRGHGRSGGDLLGLGWYERRDVRGAVNLLLGRGFKPGRIGLHGGSYGAATALLSAAAIPEVGAVVADSAFADVRDVMDAEVERKTGVPSPAVKLLRPGIALVAQHRHSLDLDAIPPEYAVPHIAPRPILFIHGSKDPVIPVEHAYRLKAASKNAADELWILEGYRHTEGVRMQAEEGCEEPEVSPMRATYLSKVTAFFDHALRQPAHGPGETEIR